MLNQETLREATRLTRAGQLTEATALLRQMLRGQVAPTAASQAPNRNRLASRAPLTIDLEANDVSEINRAPGAQRPTERPRSQRPLFDRARMVLGSVCEARRTRLLRQRTSHRRGRNLSRAPTATLREAEVTSFSSPAAIT